MKKFGMKSMRLGGVGISLALLAASSALAQMPMPAAPQGQPGIPYSGAPVEPNNQAVVDQLHAMGLRPYHTLTPVEARKQPTFADGVKAVMQARGMSTTPPPGTTERDITVQGAAGSLHALMYKPTSRSAASSRSSSTSTAAAG